MLKFCLFRCLLGGWTVHLHSMAGQDWWLRARTIQAALRLVPKRAIWGEARP